MILLLAMSLTLFEVRAKTSPPHIIFVLCDDVGWADTSLVGSSQIPTPNLDALAANGRLLSQYYTLPLCTPSRSALMTGQYPIRLGLQDSVFLSSEKGGLNTSVATIAERLKSLGYKTHALGKWHLGYSSIAYTPRRRGFDTFYGSYGEASNYFNPFLNFFNHCGVDFWDNEDAVTNTGGAYSTHLLARRAVDVICHHDTRKPLFLYLSTAAAHGQTVELTTDAPKRNLAKFPYIGDRNRTLLAGTVDALDESIGRVVKALSDRGMLSNSVIVFTSDNGGIPWGIFSNTGSNWPLRGTKGTLWEGGIRVPALIWSPHLPRNRDVVLPQLAHVVDWLPTLYSAAGGRVADLGNIDGLNLWPALSTPEGSSGTPWPRREFLVNADSVTGLSAYRDGDYKLVAINGSFRNGSRYPFDGADIQVHIPTPGGTLLGAGANASSNRLDSLMTSSLTWEVLKKLSGGQLTAPSGWRQRAAVKCRPDTSSSVPGLAQLREGYYLFDLARDPCELNNLAQEQPSVIAEMSKKLEIYLAAAQPAKLHRPDTRGYPEYNDCLWARWEDRAQTTNRTCPCP
ncbi:arylsulfatase B-like [Haemaphysalis longicornis]